jgi:hypothetical protein
MPIIAFFESLLRTLTGKRRPTFKLNIEIILVTGQLVYSLNKYQRLNCTILKSITVPFSGMTKTITDKDYINNTAMVEAYLFLMDTASQRYLDAIPLYEYVLSPDYKLDKHLFDMPGIDWTQSYIQFPNAATVTANNGKGFQIIVGFEDTKDSGLN